MAKAGVEVRFSMGKGKVARGNDSLKPLQDVVDALQSIDKDISLKYQTRALQKAAKPGMDALRAQVSQLGQVTGNLAASVSKASRKYTNNKRKLPVGVVVVGFRRPTNSQSQKMATPAFAGGSVLKGPNRAYHSHLVEYGTQSRTAGKSRRSGRKRVVLGGRLRTLIQREKQAASPRSILSSFSSRGPFSKAAGGRGQYPKDFITTGTVRGAPAQRPLQKAFNASKGQIQSVLDTEMRKALAKAVKEMQTKSAGAG